jgi:hypothetical protein
MSESRGTIGSQNDDPDIRRRQLLFRGWHRGTREIDLIFGALDARSNAAFSGSFSSSTAGCSAADVAFLIRTVSGAWIGNGSIRVPLRNSRQQPE